MECQLDRLTVPHLVDCTAQDCAWLHDVVPLAPYLPLLPLFWLRFLLLGRFLVFSFVLYHLFYQQIQYHS